MGGLSVEFWRVKSDCSLSMVGRTRLSVLPRVLKAGRPLPRAYMNGLSTSSSELLIFETPSHAHMLRKRSNVIMPHKASIIMQLD